MGGPDFGNVDIRGAIHRTAVGKDEQEIKGDGGVEPGLVGTSNVELLENRLADENGTT